MQALGLFLPSTCRTRLGLRPLDVIHSCRARRGKVPCRWCRALIDAHHTQCGRIPPKERHVTTETWMTHWNHCSVRSYFSLVFAALLSIISFKERYSIDEGKGGLLLSTGFSFSCFDQLQRRPPIPGTSMKTGSLSWPSVTKLMHSQRGEWVGE